jgi:PAS domain S-box-containing protein
MGNQQTDTHKGSILIVDDDLSSLNTLSSLLTNQGYDVRGVPDGPMALTVTNSNPPELVLLDVKLPGMDGFEVCRQIKANEKESGIPVLFLSALDETADKIKGFNAGGLDFISKPFQAEEVLARVDTHLALSRLNRNLELLVEERTAELTESAEALTEQIAFERLIAELAARLAQVLPENIDTEIQEILGSLGQFLKSERAFLFQFTNDEKSLKNTHVWAAEGFSPQSEIFELDLAPDIPWVARQICSGGVIIVGPRYARLPDEAQELQRQLERDGISSGFVVPIFVEGRSIGMFGLDTVEKAREYSAPLMERMRVLADMIGSALQRVRAQRKLKQYQHIVESTTSIVGLVDHNYVYQYVNDAYCAAFQKNRQEIIGGTVADLLGQEMFDQELKPHYDRCFAGEEVVFQSWAEFPDFGNRFMDVRYSPFFGSDRKVSAVVVSAHDVTEVKQLEMKLQESQERFQVFMNNIPASVYIKDESDRHIYGNQKAIDSVGKQPDEFVGMTTRDFWPPKLADKLIELDRKVINENIPRITEEWRNTEAGDKRWRKDIKFAIMLESGEKLLGGIAIDITDLKQKEEDLRDAYVEIEQLKQKLEQENVYLREEIELRHRHEEIIGNSQPVFEMLDRAEQVSQTDSTVLILGETGTGKELLANAIHRLSRRKDRTMIKVNCAALPATLIESELFGREKGAYTGALSRQIGRFEIADGSTLFLDEIGEMSLELQAKLLRVLQEGQFERLGSPKTVKVDVRIIASTNRDLARAVKEGKFREDLYYRLNVFSLTVPPLRDRTEDIPLLVWAFIKELEGSMGKTIDKISKKNLTVLQQYAWPGNIRELRNLVENAMIISKGKLLRIIPPADPFVGRQKTLNLEDVERNHIIDVLRKTAWRIRGKNGAAEMLGMKPTTLDSRMKKLGIIRPK